jgi:NAD(P)-dependent dehydrogenase (short-subunit alcohol dehydrogenase family)
MGETSNAHPVAAASTLRLDDRVVILTGASSGLGVQFASALDAAGARVVLAARRAAELRAVARELSSALVVPCDVTDATSRDDLLRATVGEFGRVDGLVNNAGISNVAVAMKETIIDFRHVLEVNLVAPFALSQAAARVMKTTGGGSIVNISSISGVLAFRPLPAAGYVASKGGLTALTRELAVQWARYHIRVNALAPGPFTTEMTQGAFEPGSELGDWMANRAPAGRPGRPGELNTILLTLLHPSSAYLTGQAIAVDGGLTAC